MIEASHDALGEYRLVCEGAGPLLFTENETNVQLLYGVPNPSPHVKDAFHEAVVRGNAAAVNPDHTGTKAAAHYQLLDRPVGIASGSAATCSGSRNLAIPAFDDFDRLFAQRRDGSGRVLSARSPRAA